MPILAVAQRLEIRVRPLFHRPFAGFLAERALREHEELGQSRWCR